MKQIKLFSQVALITLFSLLTSSAYATANFSTDKSALEPGEEFTISLKIDEVAAWNISIEATGAVENCALREVDVTEDALNTTKTFIKTCQAKNAGDIIISLNGDYTTETGTTEELSGSWKVLVSKKEDNEEDNEDDSEGNDEETPTNNSLDNSTPDTGSFIKGDDAFVISNAFYLIGFTGILIGGAYLIKRRF